MVINAELRFQIFIFSNKKSEKPSECEHFSVKYLFKQVVLN